MNNLLTGGKFADREKVLLGWVDPAFIHVEVESIELSIDVNITFIKSLFTFKLGCGQVNHTVLLARGKVNTTSRPRRRKVASGRRKESIGFCNWSSSGARARVPIGA